MKPTGHPSAGRGRSGESSGLPISKGREARGSSRKGQRGASRQVPQEPRAFCACGGWSDQPGGIPLLEAIKCDQELLWNGSEGWAGAKVQRVKGRGAADGKG